MGVVAMLLAGTIPRPFPALGLSPHAPDMFPELGMPFTRGTFLFDQKVLLVSGGSSRRLSAQSPVPSLLDVPGSVYYSLHGFCSRGRACVSLNLFFPGDLHSTWLSRGGLLFLFSVQPRCRYCRGVGRWAVHPVSAFRRRSFVFG